MKQIPLTQGKFALVDDEDFEELNKYKWYWDRYYARRSMPRTSKGNQQGSKMHRVIINTPKGMHTDHIDGNKLNNQKSNLRICTNAENCRNSGKRKNNHSGYKGVHWFARGKKWKSCICVNYKIIHLGSFDNKIDAAVSYNEAAKKYFGEFAHLNIIKS